MERPGEEKVRGRPRRRDVKPGAEEHHREESARDSGRSVQTPPSGYRPLVGPYVESPKRSRPATGGGEPLSNRDRADLAAIRILERRKAERLRARKPGAGADPKGSVTQGQGGEVTGPDRVTDSRRRQARDGLEDET